MFSSIRCFQCCCAVAELHLQGQADRKNVVSFLVQQSRAAI